MGADATRLRPGKSETALHAAAATRRRGKRHRATAMTATIQTLEPAERPPTTMSSRLDGELLEVSMGPQHPSTHGVFRMNVALEGEIVRKLKRVFGYLHRNHEKIGENATYLSSMPYTDRLDYFCKTRS